MERRAVLALAALFGALAPHIAAAQAPAAPLVLAPAASPPLGAYEAEALRRALDERGLTVDPGPAGKILRRLHVVNLPVFGAAEGFLRQFNVFHVTSREHSVAREVLVRPGEVWDAARVDETRRRLRDPLFTTLVVAVPVRADGGTSGQVDLLVVTRDIWSLRMNSRYELQESVITELSLSISENNLFGLRKQVALVFDMDLGAYSLGPQYVDKNIAGTHLALLAKLDALFTRGTTDIEGSKSFLSFSYPLWSLDQRWGAGVEMTHFDGVRRSFLGPELRAYETVDGVLLPWEYDERDLEIASTVSRQTGRAVKHRLTLGHILDLQRPEVRDGFPGDDAARAEFAREVLPRSERSSALFGRYTLFTPVYVVYRNIDSFDLAEDQRLGPELVAELGSAMIPIGSEVDFLYGSLTAGWNLDLAGDGLARVTGTVSGRRQDGEFIDLLRSATVTVAAPSFRGMRLAAQASWARRSRETNNRFFTVGGDSGLRGYTIAAFAGTGTEPVRVLTNVELRTRPVPILFSQVGAVVFWDAGHAANCYRGCENSLALHHDVGVGGRMLVPQLQPFVFRFDWAVPLTGSSAGLPGRFIAGVNQIF